MAAGNNRCQMAMAGFQFDSDGNTCVPDTVRSIGYPPQVVIVLSFSCNTHDR